MLSCVQLTLMMGQVVPAPVPQMVVEALAEVEVEVQDTGQSGFQLTFSIDKRSPLQTLFLLTGGQQSLFMRVVLVATVNGVINVLMDGVVTNNEISPGDKGSNSTMKLTGKDLTVLMDQSNGSSLPFPASSIEGRVDQILTKYGAYGIGTSIVPAVYLFVPDPNDQIPSQQGTDLYYIQQLARMVGYVFYLDPGPLPGLSKAYWGPPVKAGPVQPGLSADMDAYTNVESMHFRFDQERNRNPLLYSYNEETGDSLQDTIPPTIPLDPRLGMVSPQPTNTVPDRTPFRDDISKRPVSQAVMMGMAAAAEYAEAVSCSGSLDVTRYGGVLKARQLVGVRGGGPGFDGLYYVKSVTHRIKRGEYKQDFTLTRNGLVSTEPTVNV